MPFPVIPVALGGGVVGLLLLSRKKSTPNTLPPIPNNGGGGGGPVRPKVVPNPPPGSGTATATPACGPNDDPKCRLGLLVHTVPDTDKSTLIGPEDSGPTSPHVVTGDPVALIETAIADQSDPPTTRQWAKVKTVTGTTGYVSYIDPQGRSNFANVVPPSNQPAPDIAGIVGARHGWGPFRPARHRNALSPRVSGNVTSLFKQCVAPQGCYLRTMRDMNARSNVVVKPAQNVEVLGSSNGWTRVRLNTGRQMVDGWVPSNVLA